MLAVLIRFWRRRRWRCGIAAAHEWQDAERAQAAEHDAAVRRILAAGKSMPDPGARKDRS